MSQGQQAEDSEMSWFVDLYSDTQTKPSSGMLTAMVSAEVGDEQEDADPTTSRLCERVAKMLGMEDAVFLPSGTMCNLVSILVHTRPGDEIIVDEHAHIYNTEGAGASAIAGVSVKAIPSQHGLFTTDQLAKSLRAASRTAPRSSMVSLEQTTNFGGGAIWPLERMRAIRDLTKEVGVASACGISGHVDAVPACRGIGNSQKRDRLFERVFELMGLARGHVETFSGDEKMVFAIQLHDCLAREDEEELPGAGVEVTLFRFSRGDQFLDYVQVLVFEKVPAIALVSPGVVLGILDGYGGHVGSLGWWFILSWEGPAKVSRSDVRVPAVPEWDDPPVTAA
jgi:hypothetical protein